MKKLILGFPLLFLAPIAFADIDVSYEAVGADQVRMSLTYTDHVVAGGGFSIKEEYFDVVSAWAFAPITGFAIQNLTASTLSGEIVNGSNLRASFWVQAGGTTDWAFIGDFSDWLGTNNNVFGPTSQVIQDGYGATLGASGDHGIGFINASSEDIAVDGTISYTFMGNINDLPTPGVLALLGLAGISTRRRRR